MDTIKFEQLVYAKDNKDVFVKAKDRMQHIVMVFASNTLMQMLASDLYYDAMDAHIDLADEANHSPRFLKEVEDISKRFEELQTNKAFEKLMDTISAAIIARNEIEKRIQNDESNTGS